MNKTRVLLVDDHRIIREGLRALLEQQPDFEILGEAGDGRSAVRMVREHKPDVVILDVAMPDLNGIEACRQIVSENPYTRVLALSMHSGKKFVSEMLAAGASGYLLKDSAVEELVQALKTVVSNKIYLSPQIAGIVVEDYVQFMDRGADNKISKLTAREREILQLIAEGNSTKEIAATLNLSVKTIESHRRQIMEKLELYNVAELTKYAVREGLTPLE